MQRLDHAPRDRVEFDAARSFDEHDEFVATHAADAVDRAHRRLQALRDRAQNPVPRAAAEALVDVGKPIDVDQKRTREDPRFAPPARDHSRRAVERQRAVRQPREPVVQLVRLALLVTSIAREQGGGRSFACEQRTASEQEPEDRPANQ